jgi:hypothetical protein
VYLSTAIYPSTHQTASQTGGFTAPYLYYQIIFFGLTEAAGSIFVMSVVEKDLFEMQMNKFDAKIFASKC